MFELSPHRQVTPKLALGSVEGTHVRLHQHAPAALCSRGDHAQPGVASGQSIQGELIEGSIVHGLVRVAEQTTYRTTGYVLRDVTERLAPSAVGVDQTRSAIGHLDRIAGLLDRRKDDIRQPASAFVR